MTLINVSFMKQFIRRLKIITIKSRLHRRHLAILKHTLIRIVALHMTKLSATYLIMVGAIIKT